MRRSWAARHLAVIAVVALVPARKAFHKIWKASKCWKGEADFRNRRAIPPWAREPGVADHRLFLCRTFLRRPFCYFVDAA
jgi:hypothetical protein